MYLRHSSLTQFFHQLFVPYLLPLPNSKSDNNTQLPFVTTKPHTNMLSIIRNLLKNDPVYFILLIIISM